MDAVTDEFGDCVCTSSPVGAAAERRVSPFDAHLYIEVEQVGGVVVLSLDGEIGAYTLPTLQARIEAALKHSAASIVVDLADVPFLDAEGIGALIRARKRAQVDGGALLLAQVPEQGRKTLAVKGLASVLPCFPTVGDAVTFLDARTAAR